MERPLVRFVRGVARDREALEPPLRHLACGEHAEQRQHDPHTDHDATAPHDQVGEALEQRRFFRCWTALEWDAVHLFTPWFRGSQRLRPADERKLIGATVAVWLET